MFRFGRLQRWDIVVEVGVGGGNLRFRVVLGVWADIKRELEWWGSGTDI